MEMQQSRSASVCMHLHDRAGTLASSYINVIVHACKYVFTCTILLCIFAK